MEIPVSGAALEAAERAYVDGEPVEEIVRAFLEASGFEVQRTNVVSDTLKIQQRLVGPWSDVD